MAAAPAGAASLLPLSSIMNFARSLAASGSFDPKPYAKATRAAAVTAHLKALKAARFGRAKKASCAAEVTSRVADVAALAVTATAPRAALLARAPTAAAASAAEFFRPSTAALPRRAAAEKAADAVADAATEFFIISEDFDKASFADAAAARAALERALAAADASIETRGKVGNEEGAGGVAFAAAAFPTRSRIVFIAPCAFLAMLRHIEIW